MAVLTTQQRNTLESAVKQARKLAEIGAQNALKALAVDNPEPFAHLSPEQRALRNRLRSKARLLGDELLNNGIQQISHLGYELAYENWHKMLFAKFLVANDLLIYDNVPVSLEECEELAGELGYSDKWDAAAGFASKMLPAIFRPDDPLMQVPFASDDRIKLEGIIDTLDNYIFTAGDALGWVYQFWQSEAKEAINASGDKIDGAKLPAVTQLFTEPYMVNFLIDNTLGAWWVSRNPGIKPPIKFEYLRVAPTSSRSENDNVNNLSSSRRIDYNFYNPYEEVTHLKGNLPHWRQEGKIYFVTFRTADSMPQEKLKEWESEVAAWKSQNPGPLSDEQKKEYYKRFPAKMQEYLDAGYGACHLKKVEIKIVVKNALKHFNGDRYELDEFVVAANHVHALVEPKGDNQLSDILHSWKSFTANEINKITGETGTFWQKESFDHLVRSEASLEKFRDYIRNHNKEKLRQDDGATIPAAGTFEGWPDKTAEITSLDPCMGSGHFVASLFTVFAALRMHEEGISKEEATDKVIAENLHGLEIDPRCTQIAAFNLALTAWKFCGHYKQLPEMNLACSGIAPKGKKEDWVKLVAKEPDANKKLRLENGLKLLYDHFQLAPELGSLLDPSTIKPDLYTASFEELQPVLLKALEGEADKDLVERGVMAAGIAKAGQLLNNKYILIITNPPYLGYSKMSKVISNYVNEYFKDSKQDLANVFLERMLELLNPNGIVQFVMPQNWLFVPTYQTARKKLLLSYRWNLIAILGENGFSSNEAAGAFVILISISKIKPDGFNVLHGIDLSELKSPREKGERIFIEPIKSIIQKEIQNNLEHRFSFELISKNNLLSQFADCYEGLSTGDTERFIRCFWEMEQQDKRWWSFLMGSVNSNKLHGGKEQVLFWEEGKGSLVNFDGSYIKGSKAWGRKGVRITLMRNLSATYYTGELFDKNAGTLVPKNQEHLLPILCYALSGYLKKEIRKFEKRIYPKLSDS